MTPSLADVAAQYAWLYADKLTPPRGTWDAMVRTDGAYVGIKHLDADTSLTAWRGSTTFLDWLRDFELAAVPVFDPHLGWIHPGFKTDVLSNIGYVNSLCRPKVFIAGHSKGAGDALIFGGFRITDGLDVSGAYLFGCPRAGGPRLTEVWSNTPVDNVRNATPNGHDLVTDVPVAIDAGGVGVQYQQVRAFTDISFEPPPDDPWSIFRYHHFYEYARAVGAAGPQVDAIKPDGYPW